MSVGSELPVRRAIASLIGLARRGLVDARLLLDKGSPDNAARLAAGAALHLAEALAVAEDGFSGAMPRAAALVPRPENPFGVRLDRLRAALQDSRRVLPDGRLSLEADRDAVARALSDADALHDALAAHFGTSEATDTPAARRDPPRPPPKSKPPSRAVAPARREPSGERGGRDAAAEWPAVRPAPVAAHVTSSDLWALADAWSLGDLQTLDLLGHAGGLTKKGTRPRFRLDDGERERFLQLRDLDDALAAQGHMPRAWLRKRIAGPPFAGRTPLDLILAAPETARPACAGRRRAWPGTCCRTRRRKP